MSGEAKDGPDGRAIYLIETPPTAVGKLELLNWLRDARIGVHIYVEGCICVLPEAREVPWPDSVVVHRFGSDADLREHLAAVKDEGAWT